MQNFFEKWLSDNYLIYQKKGNYYRINKKTFYLIPNKEKILDSDLLLNYDDVKYKIDYYAYQFGDQFYYHSFYELDQPVNFQRLENIGNFPEKPYIPFLGIHSEGEILNAVGSAKDWVKKAKFFNYETIGICEKNSLSSVIKFIQQDIDIVIGMSIDCKINNQSVGVKLYVKDEIGWHNLLRINHKINVDQENIEWGWLCENRAGLHVILSQWVGLKDELYQFDPVEFTSNDRDKKHLKNLNKLIVNKAKCILIHDVYYPSSFDFDLKKQLNEIGKMGLVAHSRNQFMKPETELILGITKYFPENYDYQPFINDLLYYTKCINSSFKLDLSFKLPRYILSEEDKLKGFGSNKDKILSILKSKLKIYKDSAYKERIKRELSLIKKGGFVDYFLILEDIISWAEKNDILVGFGRGSSGGSLIAYFLGITKIDPIKYGLLFERFLNEARIKKSLPDIDTDFESKGRDRVKEYMEQRYGSVCSVGTYQRFHTPSIIQHFGRIGNIPPAIRNILTSKIVDFKGKYKNLAQIIASAQIESGSYLKKILVENGEFLKNINSVFKQPISSGVHACATIITPKLKGKENLSDWIPVKKMGDQIVSQWEGDELEYAGYLKEDILGIIQLDKFKNIIRLVKKNHDIDIDIYKIKTNDREVFKFFKKGWNGDVFQFGTDGLTNYSKEVKPTSLEHLTAMVSLYRPGPMLAGATEKYVSLKNNLSEPTYDWGCKDITLETYGLMIYQEQIMKITQVLADFSLAEADGIRKAMGKKIHSLMKKYEEIFISKASEKGCPNPTEIWDKMKGFAGYSFNKSHATAYALTGYVSQYLKVHFPLEYWMTALKFCKNDKKGMITISKFIKEIRESSNIKIVAVDINNSSYDFTAKKDKIFWSFTSIKFVGEKAAKEIIEERNKNGKYYSFDEFLERIKETSVNVRVIENLILCGAFDDLNKDRRFLLEKLDRQDKNYYEDNKFPTKSYQWELIKIKLSGIGHINYKKLFEEIMKSNNKFVNLDSLQRNNDDKIVATGGILQEIKEKKYKKGTFAILTIDQNNEILETLMWNDNYQKYKDELQKDKIILIEGYKNYDNYKNKYTIHINNLETLP